ncbi:hypothetical protein [Larsenimonas rhizosphaerae]|uniref:Uncharacterized protein n=1 Tax=Larsenimonas rhizosphaerae TaxID=2944682 RepID=A0AA41ZLF1_9GAMM|nr:hypothetical protein [Larsenimonas rhizosphaerae]MCX2523948.1 hypothetical protein [Larsenimonas rhizosphaerae]
MNYRDLDTHDTESVTLFDGLSILDGLATVVPFSYFRIFSALPASCRMQSRPGNAILMAQAINRIIYVGFLDDHFSSASSASMHRM